MSCILLMDKADYPISAAETSKSVMENASVISARNNVSS